MYILKKREMLFLLCQRCYDNEVPDIEVPDIEVPDPSKDIEVPDIEVPVTLRSQTLYVALLTTYC